MYRGKVLFILLQDYVAEVVKPIVAPSETIVVTREEKYINLNFFSISTKF